MPQVFQNSQEIEKHFKKESFQKTVKTAFVKGDFRIKPIFTKIDFKDGFKKSDEHGPLYLCHNCYRKWICDFFTMGVIVGTGKHT